MRKFRAVCTDIDGTLLDKNRQLSQRTLAAFKSLPIEIPVILASSRMPSAMRHLQAELNILNQPLICFNGGYVVHYSNDNAPRVLDTVMIPTLLCEAIIKLTAGIPIHVSLYQNNNWYARGLDQWTAREETVTKVSPTIKAFDEVIQEWHNTNTGAHKVMCMGTETEMNELESNLNAEFATQVHVYRSKNTYIEIAPRAISKASALDLVLKSCFNLDMSDVIAFGDNFNDVEMIQQAGCGIAVANAIDEVKAVAQEITLHNKEDGVAIAIEKYFL